MYQNDEKQKGITDVYMLGGTVWNVDMTVEVFKAYIQENPFESDFISVKMSDGTYGYLRRSMITGFCEHEEE